MNGAIGIPSTVTLMSSRGLLTLKTFSAAVKVPFSPVTDSIVAVSIPGLVAAIASWRLAVSTKASNVGTEPFIWVLLGNGRRAVLARCNRPVAGLPVQVGD